MNAIKVNVIGIPKGQPRARAFYRPGLGCRMYDPGSAEAWKQAVAAAIMPHKPEAPLTGPVCMNIEFSFPRPKSHYRTGKHAGELREDAPQWHTSKPDRDNAEKAVMDCLTQIGVWRDDCVVCAGSVTKIWAREGGARISIEELNP